MAAADEVLDHTDSGSWVRAGTFSEAELTKDRFDEYFRVIDGVSGWMSGRDAAASLRRDDQAAWRLDMEEDENHTFYYLLQQENGDLHLTYGCRDPEGETGPHSDDSSIRWLFKLERIGLLTCSAQSEGIHAFMEPAYDSEGPS